MPKSSTPDAPEVVFHNADVLTAANAQVDQIMAYENGDMTRLVWRRAGGEWMEGKPCAECGQPTTGLSSFCPNCHSNAFEGGADIG